MSTIPRLLSILLLVGGAAALVFLAPTSEKGKVALVPSEEVGAAASTPMEGSGSEPAPGDETVVDAPAPDRPSQGWEHPLTPNLAAWREAARREPGEAMALAVRLSQCLRPLALKEKDEEADFARRRRQARDRGDTEQILQRIDEQQAEARNRRADCMALDAGFKAEMLSWYERAAREADDAALRSNARLAYVRQAFVDFPGEADILARLDEAQRRRDLARAWLLDELEAGNERALEPWLDALHDASPLFPRADPVTQQAWGFVYQVRHARRGGGDAAARALWDDAQAGGWYTGQLTPEQIAAALEAGRAHYLRLFGPPGG
jgi:hypothetical protein